MYAIARRAGVGQATLYRHFATRDELLGAIFSEQLDELEQSAGARSGDAALFEELLRRVVSDQARFHGLVDCIGSPAGAVLRERLDEVLAGPLGEARSAGVLRPDVELADVHRVIAMVDGALRHETDPEARAREADRVLELVLGGLVVPTAN